MEGVTSSGPSPVFLTVTVLVTGEPAVTVPYASDVVFTVATPAMPVPFSGMLWNPMIFALSAKFRLAVVGPVAAGSNVTFTVQLLPGCSVAPSQPWSTVKLVGSTPATYAWSITSGSWPALVTLTGFVARGLVLFTTSTEPRSSDPASNETFGCGAAGAVHGAPGPPATRSLFSKIVDSAGTAAAGSRPSHMPRDSAPRARVTSSAARPVYVAVHRVEVALS